MRAPSPGRDALLAAALILALAPVFEEIGRHVAINPWTTYVIGMVPLCVLAFARAERTAPQRSGLLWIAAALALEMLGLLAGPAQIGRLGVPLAAIGLARLLGRPALPGALLAGWLIPVPNAVLRLVSPELETLFLDVAARLASLAGADPVVSGVRVTVGDVEMRVFRGDGGLPLAIALAGAGWYAAVRRGAGLRGALAGGARFAAAAPFLQLATLTGVVTALPWLGSALAREVLTFAPWLAATAAGLVLGGREARPAACAQVASLA
jgi:hypothetical protein